MLRPGSTTTALLHSLPVQKERLRTEHQYPYSYRSVCKTLEKLRAKQKTLYMPLAHYRGHAQFDFGFAEAVIGGVRQQIAYAVMSLPYSNVRYVQAFPRECTETFQEALKRLFHFLGGVLSLISFDNKESQSLLRPILHNVDIFFYPHQRFQVFRLRNGCPRRGPRTASAYSSICSGSSKYWS